MSTFSVIDRMPGVYIDEVQVPGAIAGVATSNVAILGPAHRGDIDEPTRVTSVTQFNQEFGTTRNGDPWDHLDGFFASHAVHGFFRNGGTTCFFVRVSNGRYASLSLNDRAGRATMLVRSRNLGLAGNGITVEVQDANIVAAGVVAVTGTANLVAPGAVNTEALVDNAATFSAGDVVLIDDGGVTSERATVLSVNAAANTIRFGAALNNAYAAGTVRIADLQVGQTRFRVTDATGIEPGSYVHIDDGATNEDLVVAAVQANTGLLSFEQGLANGYAMDATVPDPPVTLQTLENTIVITPPAGPAETFADLSMDSRHSRYFRTVVNSAIVELLPVDPPNVTSAPDNRPALLVVTPLANGVDENLVNLAGAAGQTDYQRAIDALERVDEVNLISVPDRVDLAVQQAVVGHCERMQDRFAILDPGPGADDLDTIRAQRDTLASDRGFAAIYFPRIFIANPDSNRGGRILVPPSGHIAGVFARVDQAEGVHVAPANKQLRRVLGLERTLTEVDAGILNEQSINVLRFARGRGHLVWGARTLATRTQWRYVNVRRLVLYIEESIQEATEASVFKPNNIGLWNALKRQVSEFLTRVWQGGALYGREPAEGFRVRVDEELNPPDQIALGILTVEVLLRPNPPAEFIIFRVIADTGTAIVQE